MPRRTGKDPLDLLSPHERAQVLGELLKRHENLRHEAREIAQSLLEDVSVEAVAGDVVFLVQTIDSEDVLNASDAHSWGYVDPTDAAWDLLEGAIADLRRDMKKRFEAGMTSAAETICQGILVGLYELDHTDPEDVLEWAPDFPADAAADTLSMLLELYPTDQRTKVGARIIQGLGDQTQDWTERLTRVVEQAASQGRAKPA